MTKGQRVTRYPRIDGQEQRNTGMFRAEIEAVADARWRISLTINFCLCSLYLLHSLEPALCRVTHHTLAIGRGYLLPAQWVNRGMSFPMEAI